MNIQEISLDRFVEILDEMTIVDTIDLGGSIAHRGQHPDEGEAVVIQCESQALMIRPE